MIKKPIAKTLSVVPSKALHLFPPEAAHFIAIQSLRNGLVYTPEYKSERLSQDIWGLNFKNPIGMAAGFDKDAEAVDGLLEQGFGHVEIGTVPPKPQSGNPKPRLFRLSEEKSIINRMGFNSKGLDIFLENIKNVKGQKGIVGINIGKNKDTENFLSDYVFCFSKLYEFADYITVNVSSPNTAGLRSLQHKKQLTELLSALVEARVQCKNYFKDKNVPILLKIAPDLEENDMNDIAQVVLERKIEGLIVSNTTISRKDINSKYKDEIGGLSGPPLFEMSTEVLRNMYKLTEGKIPIIGVGGISTPEQAYQKIKAGASLVQIYTAFIYQGFKLIYDINKKLDEFLEKDGFKNISEAVGSEN